MVRKLPHLTNSFDEDQNGREKDRRGNQGKERDEKMRKIEKGANK